MTIQPLFLCNQGFELLSDPSTPMLHCQLLSLYAYLDRAMVPNQTQKIFDSLPSCVCKKYLAQELLVTFI